MQDTNRNLKSIFALIIILVSLCALTACGGDQVSSEDLPYKDAEITISGLEPQDFTIRVEELLEMESTHAKAEASRFNGDTVKVDVVGPTLNTFLEKYGKKQTDFELIRFTADDKYAIAIPQSVVENRDIILAYQDGGEPLDKENAPVRVIVPEERAMYWVRMLTKIEFETDSEAISSERLVLLDNVLPALGGEDIEDGKAVAVEELIETYGSGSGKVLITASDGLQKRETVDNFSKGYIKYTGENSPKFTSPDLPEGMHVHGVVSALCGDVVYYSLEESQSLMPERDYEGTKGIGFSDIIKDKQFIGGESYKLIDIDGNETLLRDAELSKGIFVKNGENWDFIGPKTVSKIATVETQKR